jgi:hypothetical protein
VWASGSDAVGAQRGKLFDERGPRTGGGGNASRPAAAGRANQWPSTFDNRDSMAIDALVMTVFMATSCM